LDNFKKFIQKRFFIVLGVFIAVIVISLSIIMILLFNIDSFNNTQITTTGIIEDEEDIVVGIYDKYDINSYMLPIWASKIVYNESLMFVRSKDGSLESAPLLYSPSKIISVRSFDLATEYVQGQDYELSDGKIKLTDNTPIFVWANDAYYPTKAITGGSFGCSLGGNIKYGEADTFFKTQIVVTYEHKDKWGGIIPKYQGDKIPKTMEKLKNKEPLKIVFYGDSITVGCNSSGWDSLKKAPFAPIWPKMLVDYLDQEFGTKIQSANTAVGGQTATWGLTEVENRVNRNNPDLVVIAFGMNDGGTVNAEAFKKIINDIIDAVIAKHPDAEFILVSTTLPNKEVAGFYGFQYTYEKVLNDISNERNYVAVAPMTSMHQQLLIKKRFYDMTANNVNHPNDFLARIYAQTIAKVFLEKY